MTKSSRLGWALLAVTVIASDLAAALAVAPYAMNAVRERDARALLVAGQTVSHRVASIMGREASRIAGAGLIVLAKGASRVYGVMLSVTPAAAAAKAESGGCAGAVAPAAAVKRPSSCPRMCRESVAPAPPVAARYYSQTL